MSGTIFETKNGDLYAMATGSKLEVLKSGTTNFVPAQGSQITDGMSGTIFETKNGDLYAMATGSKLELLKINKSNQKNFWNKTVILATTIPIGLIIIITVILLTKYKFFKNKKNKQEKINSKLKKSNF